MVQIEIHLQRFHGAMLLGVLLVAADAGVLVPFDLASHREDDVRGSAGFVDNRKSDRSAELVKELYRVTLLRILWNLNTKEI